MSCWSEWAFDVDFGIPCALDSGHDGPHRGWIVGNGDVPAAIDWPVDRP